MDVPREPVVFMKATSSIIGANDDVMLSRDSTKADWEVELGVVIGKEAKYVDEARALDHVAGYCVVNDLSERAFQLECTGQWVKGTRSRCPRTFTRSTAKPLSGLKKVTRSTRPAISSVVVRGCGEESLILFEVYAVGTVGGTVWNDL